MKRLDYLYGEDRMMSFNRFDIHLLSGEEMHEAMGGDSRPDMFANTLEIADRVEEYTIHRNLNLLPVEHKDPDAQIRKYAEAWMKENNLELIKEVPFETLYDEWFKNKNYLDESEKQLSFIHTFYVFKKI
jgi:DNA polymerase III alpha subunit